MAIGITLVLHQPIILVGPHQKAVSQSTTHAQQVGVFPMVVMMVYGQRLVVQVQILTDIHMTAPTKA